MNYRSGNIEKTMWRGSFQDDSLSYVLTQTVAKLATRLLRLLYVRVLLLSLAAAILYAMVIQYVTSMD